MTEKKNHRTVLLDYLFCHNVRWAFQYRIQQVTQKWPRVSRYWLSRKYGLEVGPTAIIGKGIYLSHPYNITIGHNVVIGENVNLHKGCTIGNIMAGNRAGSPVLGNCVWVGVNAVIVGGITVGDDVMIAPYAFVNFEVPSQSVVIGNPGQIHFKQNATEGDILNKV